jgi:aconitase B
MSFAELFVIFIMTIILVMYVQNHYNEVEYVVSKVDNKRYLVRKLPDKQEAADLLANINIGLVKVVQHMMAMHPNNKDVIRLYENFNTESISEGSIESGYTSYSVNKGEKVILCIRQKNNDFVDKNILLYVAIHELAHIMTEEVGHTDTFWANFRFLLNEAIQIGVYKKVDFNSRPEEYCGIQITSSVL